METLIVGFVGGLIGALGPVLVMLIQTRSQERQARARAALEAAVHEQSFLRQLVKDSGRGGYLAPLSLHIFHYQRILDLLTEDRLTADELKRVIHEQRKLADAIREVQTRED